MTPTEKALREKLAELVEDIWMAYERALDADESGGCEHTPDGDPLVCCDCRMRRFELVATTRLAAILAESEEPKPEPDYSWFRGKIDYELLQKLYELQELEKPTKPKPDPLPLGHPYSTFVNGNGPCTASIPTIISRPGERPVQAWRCCGQPRSAHSPQPSTTRPPK